MKTIRVEHFGGFDIKLEQRASGLFRVSYGFEITDNLDYASAAREYGECVFHALSCEGLIDNEVKK